MRRRKIQLLSGKIGFVDLDKSEGEDNVFPVIAGGLWDEDGALLTTKILGILTEAMTGAIDPQTHLANPARPIIKEFRCQPKPEAMWFVGFNYGIGLGSSESHSLQQMRYREVPESIALTFLDAAGYQRPKKQQVHQDAALKAPKTEEEIEQAKLEFIRQHQENLHQTEEEIRLDPLPDPATLTVGEVRRLIVDLEKHDQPPYTPELARALACRRYTLNQSPDAWHLSLSAGPCWRSM